MPASARLDRGRGARPGRQPHRPARDAALAGPSGSTSSKGCIAADLVGFLAAAADAGHMPLTAGQAEELAVIEAEHGGLCIWSSGRR